MKHVNKIHLSLIAALALYAGSALAVTLSFSNVETYGGRSAVANVDYSIAYCLSPGGTSDYNTPLCPSDLINNLEYNFTNNPNWGYGKPIINVTDENGSATLIDGKVYSVDEIPTSDYASAVLSDIPNTEPLLPVGYEFYFLNGFQTYSIPTCIHTETDDQGVTYTVSRGILRTPFGDFPDLGLIVRDQNGQYLSSSSIMIKGTTCTLNDAIHAEVDNSYFQALGVPLSILNEHPTDDLFNTLTPISSGKIKVKK